MPDVLGVGGEGELGVLALAPQPGEVNLQQTPGLQVRVAAVLTGLAVLDLTDHVVVYVVRVAVVGDVEEHVDLLDVVHEAAGDGPVPGGLCLLPVHHPLVNAHCGLSGQGAGEAEEG